MSDRIFGNLSGLRTVVTGASSGIGRAVAVEFSNAGADVLIHCRKSVDDAKAVAAVIQGNGRMASVVAGDLTDPAEHARLFQAAFADGPIDVWVNNAGVDLLTGEAASLPFVDKLRQLLDVDVQATMLISREVGRRMVAANGGVIINIGWDQSDRGMEGDSGEMFSAAKNAVMGFSRSLAVSLAPAVRVNCIAPGWILTAWGEGASEEWQERVLRETPLRRWGTPLDVAKMARFLASPDASYITGQVINVNGGAVR